MRRRKIRTLHGKSELLTPGLTCGRVWHRVSGEDCCWQGGQFDMPVPCHCLLFHFRPRVVHFDECRRFYNAKVPPKWFMTILKIVEKKRGIFFPILFVWIPTRCSTGACNALLKFSKELDTAVTSSEQAVMQMALQCSGRSWLDWAFCWIWESICLLL